MNAYIAAVHQKHRGAVEVLLGQKNIYLPPHGRFQFAAIGRNAVQYVIPGGVVASGETIERAAIREFHEATGVEPEAREPQLSAGCRSRRTSGDRREVGGEIRDSEFARS